jgi:hypothetical protein
MPNLGDIAAVVKSLPVLNRIFRWTWRYIEHGRLGSSVILRVIELAIKLFGFRLLTA